MCYDVSNELNKNLVDTLSILVRNINNLNQLRWEIELHNQGH